MAVKEEFNLLYHVMEGDGPPVIMLHGISQASNVWRALTTDLVASGYQGIAVDMLGHGNSFKPKKKEYYTTDIVLGTLEDWVDQLDVDPPYYFVGHSLGGYMSLTFALHHPQKVRAMVLINPLFSLSQLQAALSLLIPLDILGVRILKSTPLSVIKSFLERSDSFTVNIPADIRDIYAENIKRASPNFLLIPNTARDLTPRLKSIKPETMVIWGTKDNIEKAETFPELVSGLPNATGHIMQGCGHQPHHNEPEEVHKLIIQFFDSHPIG